MTRNTQRPPAGLELYGCATVQRVTLEQIAEVLEAESAGAAAHPDPVVQALAKRLRLIAAEVAAQPRHSESPLTNSQNSPTVSDVAALSDRPLAQELLDKTGMRPQALWRAMKAAGEPVPSHETFHVIFSGRGRPRVSPELREAIKRRTGILIPESQK